MGRPVPLPASGVTVPDVRPVRPLDPSPWPRTESSLTRPAGRPQMWGGRTVSVKCVPAEGRLSHDRVPAASQRGAKQRARVPSGHSDAWFWTRRGSWVLSDVVCVNLTGVPGGARARACAGRGRGDRDHVKGGGWLSGVGALGKEQRGCAHR